MRHELALTILAGAAVLALLYVGREVLMPITLALILSLAVSPLVRSLRHTGIGQVGAVLITVAALAMLLAVLAAMIGSQVAQIGASMPQYESTLREKAKLLGDLTLGRVQVLEGEARRVTDRLVDPVAPIVHASGAVGTTEMASTGVVPVEIRPPPASAYQVLRQVAATVWAPLQTTGTVLVVLLFVLLEHESLRDRFIRLVGGADLRSTTVAINDAGERLSGFFVSQFAVNAGVGAALWAGLAIIGLPHAGLWAVLAAVLRFVPYVGVVAAALAAMLVAAAVAPGWTLVLLTLGLFALLELVVTQLVEPKLYGHTTGLSPLSIVVAAIFWSWLWGPIGLIVSTPLTLCLVVAARHVEVLGFLDVLLGDSQALTLPQRFYQRALSGDANEIIATARAFLKRRSFAAYCDMVLMRALRLTQFDLAAGTITTDQQHKVRRAIVQVIEALGSETRKRHRWPVRKSVLDELNAGRQLRQHRESLSGQWQGPLAVPRGSIALCIGLGTIGDDIATEILVRILRDLRIDARHLSMEEFGQAPPPGATTGSVSMVCIVGIASAHSQERRIAFARDVHQRLTEVCVMDLRLSDQPDSIEETGSDQQADLLATSFQDAAQQAMKRFEHQPETPTRSALDAS